MALEHFGLPESKSVIKKYQLRPNVNINTKAMVKLPITHFFLCHIVNCSLIKVLFFLQLVTSPNRNGDSVSKISAVDDLIGCHLFAVGSVEGCPHLCAASASLIKIFRFNNQLGKFMKRKVYLLKGKTVLNCDCLLVLKSYD